MNSLPSDRKPVKSREHRRQRINALREERRAQGLCLYCPQPAEPGRSLCEHHRKCQKNRRTSKKETSRCNNCSAERLPDRAFCERCFRKNQEKYEKSYQQAKANGICAACEKLPVAPKRSMCDLCLEERARWQRERRRNRQEAGLCSTCGQVPFITNQVHCLDCFLKTLSHDHFGTRAEAAFLLELYLRQGGRCRYSGLPLTLGTDASLDHIIPLSRGGSDDRDNVQWCHVDVNQMKRNLAEADFLAMVHAIARYGPS